MNRPALAAVVAAIFCGAASAAENPVDPAQLNRHVQVLASEAFEGRGPASPAEPKTIDYIVRQFADMGLQPGGDRKADGARVWTQDVTLAQFEIRGPVAMSIKAGGKTTPWRQGEEVSLRASATGAAKVDVKDAPLVFVGYGVTAPERNWDDFKGVDLKGKIALVLVNDPDFATGSGDFGGKAMTYYGRWTYKYEEAARRGALGVLVIHETAPAAYGWATVRNSNTNAIFDVIREQPSKAHTLVEGWVQRDAAGALFQEAGLDFEALKSLAQTRAFQPVTLKGRLSVRYDVAATTIVSKNVIGVLPGVKRPDERLIYTAHWDHLGVGQPDARGDRIYNGAVDNAGGVAALIEIARAFATAPRTTRSVLFLALTAEEKGLLGSDYYASHPLYPLATTVADLNMDALRPTGPARDFTTAGDAAVTLQDDLAAAGAARGRTYSPDPRPETGSFYRSDHFSFAKRGVPAISYGSGEELVNGGKAAGTAWHQAYIAQRYHQPADEIGPDWNSQGVAEDAALLYDLGRALANSDSWPSWKPGSEFKAERDKTASARRAP